jgi:hypothetical protein
MHGRKTKTGFVAMLYQLASRAYLSMLLNRTSLDDFIEKAPETMVLTVLSTFICTKF